jgi:hypothetical protein
MAIVFLSAADHAATASADIVNVSAAFYHSVVLTSDGAVYTRGGTDTSWGIPSGPAPTRATGASAA